MALGNDVACKFISGEGPNFEFRTDSLVHGTQTMDAMRYYRGQNGVVYALGERYRPPLAFGFDGPNRTIAGNCSFERVGVVATASAPATAANKSASGAVSILNVQLGVDSYASIERDIVARGGAPIPADDSGKYFLSSMSGDYSDGGPTVMAVHYLFNGPGPAGKLIALTIVNHGSTGPEFDRLLAERKAAAGKLLGTLQQKSATEFLAAAPDCQLRLVANPATLFIYETYELPN